MRLLFLVFSLASLAAFNSFAATQGNVQIGEYLPDAKLNGFHGQTSTFFAYRGKPLVINVWASWCGPCRAEMASLERLAVRYNKNDFNLIGISIDDDKFAAEEFIRQSKLTFDNYLDHNVILERILGANTIPMTILVDADGRVLVKARGAYQWDSPDIVDAIEKAFQVKLAR